MTGYDTHQTDVRGMVSRPVLIVDDDPYVRDRMAEFLGEEGIDFETCDDPDEAVARCARQPARYSLVFMNMRFPVGDIGFDKASRIAAFKGPKVIGMTSQASLYSAETCRKWGMVEMIVKPLFKWLVVNLALKHGAARG